MTGTDIIIDVLCIGVIVGMLAYARWQGQDDRRRDERLEQRRQQKRLLELLYPDWNVVDRVNDYGVPRTADTFPAEWEQAA